MSQKTTAGIAAAALVITGATLGLTNMVESQAATTTSSTSTSSTSSSDQQGTTVSVGTGTNAAQGTTSGS